MSIRKLVGKLVVGATVGALVVAGAVGVVLAQSSPYVANTPENAALDVKAGSAELPILFNVDLRAVLLAIPNLGTDGFTFGLDSISPAGLIAPNGPGNMANVGWLFAETNYSAWDILVYRDNGGYLVRDAKTGETEKNYGGITHKTCTDLNDGPFGSSNIVCDSTFEGGRAGIALQYTDGTDVLPCSLELAVGVIKIAALATPASIMTAIANSGSAGLTAPLLFDDGTDPQDYASFAFSLANAAALTGVSEYFGDGTTNTWADALEDASSNPTGLFPQITSPTRLRLDRELGDEYSPLPSPTDPSIVFYINARLGFDPTSERLTGNRNGTYSENLVFTFYGLY